MMIKIFQGESPVGISTWQFNFKFDLSMDMYAADSIELLRLSGIQFNRHEQDGIDPNLFADLLLTSGIVLMDNVKVYEFLFYLITAFFYFSGSLFTLDMTSATSSKFSLIQNCQRKKAPFFTSCAISSQLFSMSNI